MTKLLAVLAVLGFAAPAFASEAVALSDGQLDQVAAGTGSLAPVNLNINASPIIVTQTAIALNTQTGTVNASGHGNKGKGKAWGQLKQAGFAAASNSLKINYHVTQVNAGG